MVTGEIGTSSGRTPGGRATRWALRAGALLACCWAFLVHSADVKLAWDANTEPDITGYRVHQGSSSRNYTRVIEATGLSTTRTVSGLTAGATYFFAVTAINSSGLESDYSNEVRYTVPTSPSPNPPGITLTSPVNGTTLFAPAMVRLNASVNPNGNVISKVQFYRGSTLVGEDSTSPYSLILGGVSAGNYSFSARAVYGNNQVVASAAASVQVANRPPVVGLSVPVPSPGFVAPANIQLSAVVAANGNSITAVQFLNGTTVLGQDTTAPYSWTWNGVGVGNYNLSARVLYGSGLLANSTPVQVVVSGASSGSGLPTPWLAADIGGAAPGSASVNGSEFRISGAGTIGGASDSFRFVHQTLTRNGEITARLLPTTGTSSTGSWGVMIRETTAANSAYLFMGAGTDGLYRFQRRSVTGGETVVRRTASVDPSSAWVRIRRASGRLTAYRSSNGTQWTQVGSIPDTFAANARIGLAVASGSPSSLLPGSFTSLTVIP